MGFENLFKYGKDYEYNTPVKLLDKHLYAMAETEDEQLVVISQGPAAVEKCMDFQSNCLMLVMQDFSKSISDWTDGKEMDYGCNLSIGRWSFLLGRYDCNRTS
ncbi:hypothetical protein C5167_030284 [Papaver somniferum]|nr:hypothetical protein C5167_030284 [Papaver somniferum]